MRTAWVILGRFGDCCNAIPLVLHDYQQGNHPTVVVGQEWAGLLDGIGYADRLIYQGHYSRPIAAKVWASSYNRFDKIYIPQWYGQTTERRTPNFCEEAYHLCGMEHLWGRLPLVFDKRNLEREAALIPKFKKPMVLVCTEGISHPFQGKIELFEAIRPLRDTHELVDMSLIKAHRFYDLIGLMEKAAYLITVDTGILHLARAVPTLPVITIIPGNDNSWDVSPRFKEHVARIYFDELTRRKHEIVGLIRAETKPERKLIHVWSKYNIAKMDAARRHAIAKLSWEKEMKGWLDLPLLDAEFDRNSRIDFGEHKSAPYVTDMIDRALDKANLWDIIVLTNDDTCVCPGLTPLLKKIIAEFPACWSARREHRRVDRIMTTGELMRGYKHVGADFFAFTKEWWLDYGHYMPDMFMAFENWDYVLRTIIEEHGGKEIEGLCYHEIHQGDWLKNRESPAAKHNQSMGGEFFNSRK